MLPTTVTVSKNDFDFLGLEDDLKEEILSDYLTDTYGFCHCGFMLEETNDEIIMSNILWDIDEGYEDDDEH
jgi:hypothetical protein